MLLYLNAFINFLIMDIRLLCINQTTKIQNGASQNVENHFYSKQTHSAPLR